MFITYNRIYKILFYNNNYYIKIINIKKVLGIKYLISLLVLLIVHQNKNVYNKKKRNQFTSIIIF